MSKLQYIKKTIIAGMTVEIEKTRSARFGKRIPRGENINKTPKDVEAVNRANAEKTLTRILNANFRPGDYHAMPTYSNKHLPPTPEEAKKHLDDFKRDMRVFYHSRRGILST